MTTPSPEPPEAAPRRSAPSGELYELAQRCHLLLETLHVVVYFASEPAREYQVLGLKGRPAYFASRAAALGPVPGAVVTATFGVFEPTFVERSFPKAWELAAPAQWLAARHRGVAAVLHRVLGDHLSVARADVIEAGALAREATTALTAPGRPLYAANAALPWPEEPLMALWHAAGVLREHRGDGHLAALTSIGVAPLPAMILHGLLTRSTPFLQKTRGWSAQAWTAAVGELQDDGLLESGDTERLTPAGRDLKREIERQTRVAALAGWEHLGEPRCQRLVEIVAPVREHLMASDIFPPGSPLKP